ncbi:MAG TPA: hypothetical protein VMC84_03950 [Methanocella sp.]|uniref:hypothetical protein n=1 Tax=Methanocella sp. TaxID=2052833 RepID=UPI002C6C45FF|nr:hypothetical protein [Methanocella sp.]HTY90307.1 hypothetical protein [Methanocella sp.]
MNGIPIDELISWNERLRRIEQMAVDPTPEVDEAAMMPPNSGFEELILIKSMEQDFTLQAEELLETLHLAHLRVPANK